MCQSNIKPLAVPNDFNAHACLRVFLGLQVDTEPVMKVGSRSRLTMRPQMMQQGICRRHMRTLLNIFTCRGERVEKILLPRQSPFPTALVAVKRTASRVTVRSRPAFHLSRQFMNGIILPLSPSHSTTPDLLAPAFHT